MSSTSTTFLNLLAIGTGGFIGAIARYGCTLGAYRLFPGVFPFGTLIVNVSGCLLIGILVTTFEAQSSLQPWVKLFCVTGLLGAFTTFSTFGYETIELIRTEKLLLAGAYVLLNLLLGLAAVVLGHRSAEAFLT